MLDDATIFWAQTGLLGRKRLQLLDTLHLSLDDALLRFDADLLEQIGIRRERIPEVLEEIARIDVAQVRQWMEEKGVLLVAYGQPLYPSLLAQASDAPAFLFVRGDVSLLSQTGIAIVGTRRCSPYGQRVTAQIASELCKAGLATISGLAKGIDSIVADATIESGGTHIAVLGFGLRSGEAFTLRKRIQSIVQNGGAIVSEFPLDTSAQTFTFPARNRIIAGLAPATLVTEAPQKSGALITARIAHSYGRDVFAVPGDIDSESSAGCHALIREQIAHLCDGASCILQECGIDSAVQTSMPILHDELQRVVFDVLTRLPQSVDLLAERSRQSSSELLATLSLLELSGHAKCIDAKWVRA